MMMNMFLLAIWGMVGFVSSSSESMIRHVGYSNDHVKMSDKNVIPNNRNEDVRDLQTTCDSTDADQYCLLNVWSGDDFSYCSDPNALSLKTHYSPLAGCVANSCCSLYFQECCHPETSCSSCSESYIYFLEDLETTCGGSGNIDMNKMSLYYTYTADYTQSCSWGCCSSIGNDCCSDYEPPTDPPTNQPTNQPTNGSGSLTTDNQAKEISGETCNICPQVQFYPDQLAGYCGGSSKIDTTKYDSWQNYESITYEKICSTSCCSLLITDCCLSPGSGKSSAGIVAGVLIVVVILVVGGIFWYRKKNQSGLPYTNPPTKIDDSTGYSDPTESVETPSPTGSVETSSSQQEQPSATQGTVPIFSSSGTVPNTETNPPQNPSYAETNTPQDPNYVGASTTIQPNPSSSTRIDAVNEKVRIGIETTENVANGLGAANDLLQQASGFTSTLFGLNQEPEA